MLSAIQLPLHAEKQIYLYIDEDQFGCNLLCTVMHVSKIINSDY